MCFVASSHRCRDFSIEIMKWGCSVIVESTISKTNSPANRGWIGSVLYVEDNPVNLTLVKRIFRSEPGVEVFHAPTGQLGFEMARTLRPRIILLDLNLPDMHGQDVFAKLQSDRLTRQIPVVVLSADATEQRVNQLLTAGVFSYLTKPLDFAEFENVMGFLLGPEVDIDPEALCIRKGAENA